jgi:hypothetical protein
MTKLISVILSLLMIASASLFAANPKDQKSSSSTSVSPSTGTKGGGTGGTSQKPQTMPYGVYVDQGGKDNHYIPSGWMGDYGDLKINPGCTENPKAGKNCLSITYNAKMAQGAGWTGIFWQHPANNWGDKAGGYNLTGAKKLTFWARGAKGGEKIAEFKMGGITGEYPDTDSAGIGPVELTQDWKQYVIDLNGKDVSYINGAFAWAASKEDNPEGFTIYLDDVKFE